MTEVEEDAEDRMRGIAFKEAQKQKPGFVIEDILVGIIAEDDDP